MLPIAVLLLSASCGTTLTPAQQSAAGGEFGQNSLPQSSASVTIGQTGQAGSVNVASAPGEASNGNSGVAGPDQAGGSGPSQSGGSSPGHAGSSSVTATPGAVGPSNRQTGPGFTATTIDIGIEYASDFAAESASLGNATSSGNDQALAEAVIADINHHGGVLGRQIVPVFHDTSAVSAATDPNTAAQSTCVDFSQDHRVAAAVVFSTAWPCLTQAKVPTVLAGDEQPTDDAYLQSLNPYFYDPPVFSMTEFTPLFLNRLTAEGYFSPGAKVGIFYGSEYTEPRDAAALISQLHSRGVDVAATYEYDGSNESSVANSGSSAVLDFRTHDVDHVIGLDANVTFEMIGAQEQHYYPRYALSSYLLPGPTLSANAPAAQLAGAVGVGWAPVIDTGRPGDIASIGSGPASCQRDITASGQNLSGMALAQFAAFSYCDAIRLIAAAAVAGGGFTPTQLRSGAASIGGSFPSALNLRSAYSATRTDGAGGVRDLAYLGSCSCFAYTSSQVYS